jgi:hypothetical protein
MGYRVQIGPFLLTEGEFKGHMEYIHFHVFLNGVEVGRWSETNIGQLPDSLGKLVGKAKAMAHRSQCWCGGCGRIRARVPALGVRVTIGSSQSVYNVSRVGRTDVDLQQPGTNLERFRVPV